MATYGLYLISSLMHFEPWHMFTSFIQYMFFLPSCASYLLSFLMHSLTFFVADVNILSALNFRRY
jgi:chitin synthase